MKGLGDSIREEACPAIFPQFFEAEALRHPDAIAVRYEETTMSYAQLERRSNQLARVLNERGVGPEKLVGLFLRRSPDVVVALLAVLKAGGAYLPLDPALPPERVRLVLQDAGVQLTITEPDLPLAGPTIVVADAESYSGEPFPCPATGKNAAYVIYTSGSTGRPKGVIIEHRNLVAYTRAILERLEVYSLNIVSDGPMVFGHISTFAADLGNTTLFPALASGGSINVISSERQADVLALAEYLERHPLDVLKIVPSHLSALLTGGPAVLPRKTLILGGEALSWELIDKVASFSPTCRIFNHYGPTETTIGVISGCVSPGEERVSRTVPLGLPLGHAQVALLDSHGEPAANGEAGEVVVSGEAVGRGYWKRRDLTQERFAGGSYRTGDMARRLADGRLEFVGRLDDQVKVRGYRVEPDEVRMAISRMGVENIVVAREDQPGHMRLIAYLVSPASPADLERQLRIELPQFMVPSAFICLDALPLTANGKVDRAALPAPPAPKTRQRDRATGPFEGELLAIWERHLGRTVGRHRNFFDLGGHSLIAAQIAVDASRRFGRDVQPTLLLEKPTVALMARELDRQSTREWSPLVAIQPLGASTPLFGVHGGMGTVMFFCDLAGVLGPEQPLYAFQPRGLYDPSPPNTTVEQAAADYIRAMRRVRPHGPYALLGWCFGAILAFEIAQQLAAAGEEVSLLAALEGGPDLTPSGSSWAWGRRQLADLHTESGALKKGKLVAAKVYRRWRTAKYGCGLDSHYAAGEAFRKLGRPIPPVLRAMYTRKNHAEMTRKYVARHYSGSMLLFTSGEYRDPWMGWQRVIRGRVELNVVRPDPADYHAEFWKTLGGRLKQLARESRMTPGATPAALDLNLGRRPAAVARAAEATVSISLY